MHVFLRVQHLRDSGAADNGCEAVRVVLGVQRRHVPVDGAGRALRIWDEVTQLAVQVRVGRQRVEHDVLDAPDLQSGEQPKEILAPLLHELDIGLKPTVGFVMRGVLKPITGFVTGTNC